MSFGKKSPVYEPVNKDMLPTIAKHFPNIKMRQIEDIYEIMTDDLHTETLLFVAIISGISRFIAGEKDEAGFGFGPGIKLSALSKDRTYKMQSTVMELLHDVVVELPMAGKNFDHLQEYLAKKMKLHVYMYHSCGEAIASIDDKDKFFATCGEEQKLRTLLDWKAETLKNVPVSEIIENGMYTKNDAEVADKCFNVAMEAVRENGHLKNHIGSFTKMTTSSRVLA